MRCWKSNFTRWLLTSLIIASPVYARPIYSPSIAVIKGDSCQQNTSAATLSKFRAALVHKNIVVKSEQSIIDDLGGIPSMSMEEISRSLEDRREDLLNMDYQKAINPLLEEIEELRLHAPSQKRCDNIRDAYTKLAWVYHKSKVNKKKYCATVERIARIGAFELDFRLFPPTFHKYVNDTRNELRKSANSLLNVVTKPAGLMVHIDGCPIGYSPIRLRVPEGKYQIDIEFSKGRGLFKKVVVKGDTVVEFDNEFEGSIFAEKGPCVAFSADNEKRIKSLAQLASLLGVQSVVLFREDGPVFGEKYLAVQLVDRNENSREGRIKLSATGVADKDVEKLATFMVTGKLADKSKLLSSTLNPKANPKVKWQRAMAWSLAGLAAVMTGAAVYEQIHLGKIENNINSLDASRGHCREGEEEARRRQLDSDHSIAWMLRNGFAIGAAMASVGSGAYFYVSWDRQTYKKTGQVDGKVSLTVGGNF